MDAAAGESGKEPQTGQHDQLYSISRGLLGPSSTGEMYGAPIGIAFCHCQLLHESSFADADCRGSYPNLVQVSSASWPVVRMISSPGIRVAYGAPAQHCKAVSAEIVPP